MQFLFINPIFYSIYNFASNLALTLLSNL